MIGRVLGTLALTIFYLAVVAPIAVLRRALRGNPLHHQVGDLGYWQRRDPKSNAASAMRDPS